MIGTFRTAPVQRVFKGSIVLLVTGLSLAVAACVEDIPSENTQPPVPAIVSSTATATPSPFTVQFDIQPQIEDPQFPTDLTDEELAAINGWNEWLFAQSEVVQQAVFEKMVEQIEAQFIEDGLLLWGAFTEQVGDPGILMVLRMESLNQNREELNADSVRTAEMHRLNLNSDIQITAANAAISQSLVRTTNVLEQFRHEILEAAASAGPALTPFERFQWACATIGSQEALTAVEGIGITDWGNFMITPFEYESGMLSTCRDAVP